MLLFLDSCKSKEIYLKTAECLSCSSTLSAANSPARVRPADRSNDRQEVTVSLADGPNDRPGDHPSGRRINQPSECTSECPRNTTTTDQFRSDLKEQLGDTTKSETLNDWKVSDSNKPVSSMKRLPADQYLASPIQQSSSFAYPPQSYNQMNIQNNGLNFRYSPQQYGSPLDQPMTSQMTNYMLSNNVNNLNLNSPNSLTSPQPNPYFNPNAQFGQAAMQSQMSYSPTNNQYGFANQLSPSSRSGHPMGFASSTGQQPSKHSPNNKFALSPSSLSPSSLSPAPPAINQPPSDGNLKTFNFQNRTHIHGYHNNFEPDDQSRSTSQFQEADYQDYKDEYRSDRDEYETEEDRNRNRFLSANQRSNLPLSNVDCGNNSAAPRTGSASPISSYNSPAVVEANRIKKNKFNFRKKFKIKHSPTKSKKSNKSQKGKNPGLLYSQLNKGINSGTLNSINKMQLSILNTGLIRIESEKATAIIPKDPFDLSTNKFIEHLTLLRKYNVLFKIEYFVACKTENHSFRHALRPENEIKNCNKKLLPYDYNRVVLETIPDIPCSDYVNASYVDSILKPKAYIATQGPTEETENDFWRMVYEQQSHIIVMLTKVFDFIRVMCSQYWPMDCNKPKRYGQIEVTLLTEEPLADFQIRTFKIRKLTEQQILQPISLAPPIADPADSAAKGEPTPVIVEKKTEFQRPVTPSYNKLHSENDQFRIVYQFHYEKWPTHSCPFATSILQFRRRVRIFMKELQQEEKDLGPIIAHCSDGGGRTGAYLAIDSNLEYAKEDNMYDVFSYAKRLRQQRRGLIDGVEQYKFVYECLEEALKSGKTWFPVSDLAIKMKWKSIRDQVTKINEYQREYEKILKVTPKFTIGDCAGGHRVENRSKNRDVLTIPPDNHRPYLTTFQTNDSTDYVNAVYVDGYTRSKEYIVTEWPMQDTISDCWSLIYDHDCNSVIILASPEDESTFPLFWPLEKHESTKFGPVFTVECISSNHYANIKCWLIKIHKKVVSLTELMSGVKGVPKMTQLFQITCWPEGHKVPSSTNALVELMNMVERWRQRTNYGPVVVISSDGCSRAGIYCAANLAIEQVVQHREVDVYQAVKTVRRHRPFMINNLTEYKYCYDLILTYVINFLKPESN